MTTKRREFIKALVSGLKIETDVFAIDTIKEKTEFLDEEQYLDFYQAVMSEDTFGNGVKTILKIVEKFRINSFGGHTIVDVSKTDEIQAWVNVLRRGTANTKPLPDDEIVRQLIEAGYLR